MVSDEAEAGWYCQLYVFLLVDRLFFDAGHYQIRNGLVLPTLHLLIVLVGYFPCKYLSRLKRVGIANSTSSFFVDRLFWDAGLYQIKNGLVLPTLHLHIVSTHVRVRVAASWLGHLHVFLLRW